MGIWQGRATFHLKKSFKGKLILIMSGIILLSFTAAGYFIYTSNLKLFEEEISKQFSKANEQTITKLELKMEEVHRISQSVVFNPQIERMIQHIDSNKNSDLYSLYFDKKSIEEQVFQVKIDAPYITSMYMYDMLGNPAYLSYTTQAINVLGPEIFHLIEPKISDSYGDSIWMRVSLPSSIEPTGSRETIVVARWMKNTFLQTYGMLVMTVDMSFFSNTLLELVGSNQGLVYLYNPTQDLLYTNDKAGSDSHTNLIHTDEPSRIEDNYLFVRNDSRVSEFLLISGISLEEIKKKNRDIFRIVVLAGLVTLCFTSLLIIIVSTQLLRPLKDILQGIRKVRVGDFETRIKVRTQDELGFIAESFNSMTEQVGQLIKEVYLTKLSERDAELKAIQALLNPHFLYNIFNELYWKLYMQNVKDSAQIIAAVSDMFKYSLMASTRKTTVRKEIQQLRNYLRIQTELFEADLEIIIQAADEVMDACIERTLLQPLVENVFIHAFRDKINHQVLIVRAYQQNEQLFIEITDNGSGIEAHTLKLLMESHNNASSTETAYDRERQSMGVHSVNRRIALLYGEPYRMEIDSVLNSGTTIRLVLPLQHELGDE
ncbi:HAMP domain-containing protein [Paenibacillus psychroresistens]|uniref:HAMP domain-containing protein n=1 Tax=Paenibacillus psychroresistens TaxID=1778678 RepID=A0A6B8RS16_9BACL|nr:histidine kinase [Paenibacillus psychroresistens]QGQ99201.1 HAMP domain-containing protein [Paenibacillus psychroresistens]